MPVIRTNTKAVIGIIDRISIEKAFAHKIENVSIVNFIETDFLVLQISEKIDRAIGKQFFLFLKA